MLLIDVNVQTFTCDVRRLNFKCLSIIPDHHHLCPLDSQTLFVQQIGTVPTTSHYHDTVQRRQQKPPKHVTTHDSDGIHNPCGMLLLPLLYLLTPHPHSAPLPAQPHLEHNVRGYPPSLWPTNSSHPFQVDR